MQTLIFSSGSKKNTSEEKFEKISKRIGFDALKKYLPYVRYSQHPYVEARIGNTKINVVPFYDVKIGEWKSAADRSPFHTKFMEKSLTPKMRNEVKVLKIFIFFISFQVKRNLRSRDCQTRIQWIYFRSTNLRIWKFRKCHQINIKN